MVFVIAAPMAEDSATAGLGEHEKWKDRKL